MRRYLANLLSDTRIPDWLWGLYPRRLKIWLFYHADFDR